MAQSEFKDYVVGDVLGDMRGITARAMFGGYGLYKDGVIFGIIAEDELYLKVDDTNRDEFVAFDSHPFVYEQGKHKKTTMSYWVIPEEILEDRARMEDLVLASVTINKKKKKSTKKRR
ncbi:TfoX/Sxy family protein [Patescibacteria group bacterium]|nr:TfoX/Sxy family protein [Patescibacteria group bacterium]